VKRTSSTPIGVTYRLNHGAASECFSPVKNSEINGKKVPQKITSARPTRSRLLTRKIDSREASDSIRRSGLSWSRRVTIRIVEPRATTPIRASRGPPTVEAPKA
jgi:hypothetical protein